MPEHMLNQDDIASGSHTEVVFPQVTQSIMALGFTPLLASMPCCHNALKRMSSMTAALNRTVSGTQQRILIL